MATDGGEESVVMEGIQVAEGSARNDSRETLFKQARLYNFRKSLFKPSFSAPISDKKAGNWYAYGAVTAVVHLWVRYTVYRILLI